MAVMSGVSLGKRGLGPKVWRALGMGLFGAALFCGFAGGVNGAETIPPVPKQYFNDYAGVVSARIAEEFNRRLSGFEREHSSQIVVAVFPEMLSDSSIDDYTFRVAEAWKVGQEGRDNGAVLFVFVEDRKMFLQVGYGLEGALPDGLAKQIIESEIKPHFKEGNYEAGLAAGIEAMLAAAQGEYRGAGSTAAERGTRPGKSRSLFTLILVGMFVLFFLVPAFFRGMIPGYRRRRRYGHWGGGWTMGGGSWGGGGGGGWGGGGGFSGGGFSGGGGRFGGGGAGGSW